MEKSKPYRARAIKCLQLAQSIALPEKAILVEMARAWTKLAEYAREGEGQKEEA